MWFRDLVTISLRQVVRHRRRYWGVALTIALGVAGFITVVTMGEDFKKNLNQDLELIGGATIIRCYFDTTQTSRPIWFHESTVEAIRKLPFVTSATRVAVGLIQVEQGDNFHQISAVAADQDFWKTRGFSAAEGRLFGEQAVTGRWRQCVLGKAAAQRIFGDLPAVGGYLQIGGEFYQVIGLVGSLHIRDLGHRVFLPITTAQDRFPFFLANRMYVRCASWDDVEKVAALVRSLITEQQTDEELFVEYPREALAHLRKVAGWTRFFVYLTIGATLLLGGMGIWTVMMGAVRTRTREIGLKKSMGARDSEILAQFLSEALCLSLGSAAVGTLLGRVAVELTSRFINARPSEDLFMLCVGLAFVFALVLGMGAGLYPSVRASRMDVVTATRYE